MYCTIALCKVQGPRVLCCQMCRAHAWPCLSTGRALKRRFDLTVGTAAMLAQGGGGGLSKHGVVGERKPSISPQRGFFFSPKLVGLFLVGFFGCFYSPFGGCTTFGGVFGGGFSPFGVIPTLLPVAHAFHRGPWWANVTL